MPPDALKVGGGMTLQKAGSYLKWTDEQIQNVVDELNAKFQWRRISPTLSDASGGRAAFKRNSSGVANRERERICPADALPFVAVRVVV